VTAPRPIDAAAPRPADEWIAPLLARSRFPEAGTHVVCGVSGGPDSLALLALALAQGCAVTAVHVDHGLRPGSSAEAEVVIDAAARLADRFAAGSVQVHTEAVVVGAGPNLEARARAARHRVLGPDALLGHTADDQAETVIMNLIRGAGVAGLAGIRADHRHPILALRRSETHAVCARLGLTPVQDPSNQDLRFVRNRVRAEVLPVLSDVARRDVAAVIARQAAQMREVDDLLVALAGELDPTDVAGMAGAPGPLAQVAVRSWLRGCDPQGHPPDADTVDRVLAVIRLESRACDVGAGWRVTRSKGRLTLVPPA
jgi:tRNA(Ile)-lysidine synthase